MNPTLFAFDYGTLSGAFFSDRYLTNPIELLCSRELTELLYLCGCREAEISEKSSDYQKFRALCRSFPLLDGHPFKEQITSFLNLHFQGLPELSPEACDILWRAISDELASNPRKGSDFLPKGALFWLSDSLILPSKLPQNVSPILDGNLFLPVSAQSYTLWQKEISSVLSTFYLAGCQRVIVRLDPSFRFVQPSVYHVENALRTEKRTDEQNFLLITQILRELSALCQKQSLALHLLLECSGHEAVAALRYVQHSVGLPALYWSAATREASEEMLSFSAFPHKNDVLWTLHSGYMKSPTELTAALQFAASRYPVGRLSLVTGADLRYVDIAEERCRRILEKSF